MSAKKEELRRAFGGKLNDFKDKYEKLFEQKHLKAYLRGWKQFSYGKDKHGYSIYHKVKELWINDTKSE